VAFSPDGKYLVFGSWDSTVRLWSVQSHMEITTLQGHSGYVISIAFSPDGMCLASGSADNKIKLWNIESQKEVSTLQGHSAWV
jgi:WD40 repeat protein